MMGLKDYIIKYTKYSNIKTEIFQEDTEVYPVKLILRAINYYEMKEENAILNIINKKYETSNFGIKDIFLSIGEKGSIKK
jgi:hypothetical protein